MSAREYIGARYVPLFADPLQWDATRTYEPLTVVLHQGNSYTSRQAVPANIDISNTTYWAQTGNYNAQIEQYRQEVQTFDGRIAQNATDIDNINSRIDKLVFTHTRYTAIVGDSWSDTNLTAATWPNLYASAANRSLINKAENGAGFVRTGTGGRGTTFYTQLQQVVADSNYADCDEVIILGGINDISYGVAAIENAIAQCATLINQITSTGRKVFLCFGNSGNGRAASLGNYDILISTIKEYCRRQLNIPIIDNVNWWLACSDVQLFNNDYIHPNAQGNKEICTYIQQIHEGCYSGVHRSYLEPISLASSTGIELASNDGKIRLEFDNGVTRLRSGIMNILLNSSGPIMADGLITDNFTDVSYWHAYGSGSAANDGTEIYLRKLTGQFAVRQTDSATAIIRPGIHRYANGGYFDILGSRELFNTTKFPSGKIPIFLDFVW